MTLRHLCYVVPGFPPENHSWGIGTYGQLTVNALLRRGHRVTVLSRSVGSKRVVEQSDAFRLVRLPSPEPSPHGLDLRAYAAKQYEEWLAINERDSFDYTECADWGGEGLPFVQDNTSVPVAIRVHSPGFLVEGVNGDNPSYLNPASMEMERQALLQARFVLANSQATLTQVGSCIAPDAKTFILPYICPPRDLAPLPVRMNGRRQLACVGRLEERKGQDLLVAALIELGPDAALDVVFVGADTPLVSGSTFGQELRSSAPGWLSARLSFTGAVSHNQVFDILINSHAAVQPARFENFAFAMLEAMSVGRPVLLPDLPTLDAMRFGHADLTFTVGNCTDLTRALKSLDELSDDELGLLCGEYHAFYTSTFSESATVDATLAVIDQISQSKRPCRREVT